jgi:hypothetical protein
MANISHMLLCDPSAMVSQGPGAYQGIYDSSVYFDTATSVTPTPIDPDESTGGITDSELSILLEELFPSVSEDGDSIETTPNLDTLPTAGACWHQGKYYIFDEDKAPIFTFSYQGGIYRGRINSDGVPHGPGYLVYNNDVYYYGFWTNGLENGFGMLVFANSSYTIDLFHNGRKCSSTAVSSLGGACASIKRIHAWPSFWFDFDRS